MSALFGYEYLQFVLFLFTRLTQFATNVTPIPLSHNSVK